ncbi:putative non-specific serine/threonine protein kinase [Rosa chinensis]|uniref:non-specific serine/threonine protein kinase n=1 Tax=Rosa chinensis TaxID=74649 RepID=A0A2P6QIC9_ROSCH|nr:putative non-specific serine/threonine protein kinase [Rosa chinensis]
MPAAIVDERLGHEETEVYEDKDKLSWTSASDMSQDAYDNLDNDQVLKGCFPINSRRPNAHEGLHSLPTSTLQPLSNRLQKFDARIRAGPLEEWEGRWNMDMSNSVNTSIREFVREGAIGRTKTYRIVPQLKRWRNIYGILFPYAIDPKTRMLLIKVFKAGPDNKINGCIATAKKYLLHYPCLTPSSILLIVTAAIFASLASANVYHTTKSDDEELAIKVYKTSVLDFKYVQGDRRYRKGYCKHNPREMVKVWVEKEKRNLDRMVKNGIRCPTAIDIKDHVLVMEFIGKTGWPAPRLRDAALSLDKLRKGYREDHLYIIDVSQAVEPDHVLVNEFLCRDCVHVSDFFKKKGVAVMTIRELFDFIVDPCIADEAVDTHLDEVQQKVMVRRVISAEHVKNVEADVIRITSGEETADIEDPRRSLEGGE